jgi:hypothetical protein
MWEFFTARSRIRERRKRCTLEFWFHAPHAFEVVEEIILASRCVTKAGDDLSKLCVASDRENALWELALLPTGELEFRSSGVTILGSSDGGDEGDFGATNSEKFKIKIRKKGESEKPAASEGAGKFLAPPKSGTGRLPPPRSRDDSDGPRG